VEQIIAAETAADDFVEDKQQRTSDKWNEEGPWLLLLVLPMAALLFRRGLLFSIGFAVLLGVTARPSSALAFGWDDLWLRPDQQAVKLFQQGKTKQASELFESSEWKGAAAYRSGDYEKAIEHFSQQNHSRANFNSGNALAFAGRLQESLEAFERVLADSPQNVDAQYNHDLIEKLLKEQQKKKQQQEGQQGANQKNKQDQQDGSSQTQEKQKAQSAQGSSGDNAGTSDQQTAEGVKNNAEKESTAEKNNKKFDEEKTESPNNEEGQKKIDGSAAKENAKNKKQDSTPVDLAKQQFLEQWLRKIPDDPGRLLRNKMEREFQRRGKQNFTNEQYW
jgi:Ca-activated chloride channel family protein